VGREFLGSRIGGGAEAGSTAGLTVSGCLEEEPAPDPDLRLL